MAETKKTVVDIKIETANSAKSIGEMNKALKDLKSELNSVAAGSAEWKKLSSAINETEGKIGDINDSFKTLAGSGVDRVNSSIGLFKEGLFSFDFGKMGIALKGLGSAFKAVLPFAIIEAAKALYENWDAIRETLGKLIPALDSASKLTRELERMESALLEKNKAVNAEYQNQIVLLEALGGKEKEVLDIKNKMLSNDIKHLELQAQLNRSKEIDAAMTDTLYEKSLKLFNFNLLADDSRRERLKAFQDESAKIEQEISAKKYQESANRINAIDLEIKKTKEHSAEVIKRMLDEAKKEDENKAKAKKNKDDKLAESQKLFEEVFAQESKNQDAVDASERKRKEDLKKQEEDRAKTLVTMRDDEIALEKKTNAEKVAGWEKAENDKQKAIDAGFQHAQLVTQNLQGISDLAFSLKASKLKKGSAEEEALMKRQFEVNKKLQVAQTVISTITGAREAYKSLAGIPVVGVGLGIAAAAAATLAGLSAIQKINSTKFESASAPTSDSGAGASVGGGNVSAPNTQAPSTGSIQPFTRLDESGRNQSMPMIKTYVVESEMSDSQKRVGRLTEQASFG